MQTKGGWSVSRLSQPSHHCQGRKFPVQCSSAVVSWSSALIVPTMHSVLCILLLKGSSCITMLLYCTTLEGNWQYCGRNRVYKKHCQKKGIGTDTVTGTVCHCSYCCYWHWCIVPETLFESSNGTVEWHIGRNNGTVQWYNPVHWKKQCIKEAMARWRSSCCLPVYKCIKEKTILLLYRSNGTVEEIVYKRRNR